VRTYTLPDGRTIKVDAERFMAPEALFNPVGQCRLTLSNPR